MVTDMMFLVLLPSSVGWTIVVEKWFPENHCIISMKVLHTYTA